MLLFFTGNAPDLDDWQFQYGVGGEILNREVGNTFTDITAINGLDTPDIRSIQADRDGEHGGYTYAKYYSRRTVEISLDIYAPNETYLDRLKRNFLPKNTGDWLFWKPVGEDIRMLYCKPTGFRYATERIRVVSEKTIAQLMFQAEDPRWYAQPVTNVIHFPNTTQLGRIYPKTYPYTYSATQIGGNVVMTSPGSIEGTVELTFTGEIDHPVVQNQSTGKTMYLDVVTVPGDQLRVDIPNKRIELNGRLYMNALRSGSDWLDIQPGNNNLQFSCNAAGASAQVVVTTRDAWI